MQNQQYMGRAMQKCAFGHFRLCRISNIWAAPCKHVPSGIFGQHRPRSACASAQSDQGLHCPQSVSLDTTDCINEEQRPRWLFAQAHDELSLRILDACLKTLFRLTRPLYQKLLIGMCALHRSSSIRVRLTPTAFHRIRLCMKVRFSVTFYWLEG